MSASDKPRQTHLQSPEYPVEHLSAAADPFDKDRTDVLVETIRKYIEEITDSEMSQELVATKYCGGQSEFETVKQLVGTETTQRSCFLEVDLEAEPLDFAASTDADIYGGGATTVDTADGDER